eukprot:COSAG01_NODE_903_length_12848_cov_7.966899_16_plen_229_part_00
MQSHPHHGGVLGAEAPVSVHTQCFGALARGIGAVATAAQRLLSQHARTRRFGQLGERFGHWAQAEVRVAHHHHIEHLAPDQVVPQHRHVVIGVGLAAGAVDELVVAAQQSLAAEHPHAAARELSQGVRVPIDAPCTQRLRHGDPMSPRSDESHTTTHHSVETKVLVMPSTPLLACSAPSPTHRPTPCLVVVGPNLCAAAAILSSMHEAFMASPAAAADAAQVSMQSFQ